MITRIYADNFRCLGNFDFQPGRINLLLGGNGSGKTSLLAVLLAMRDLIVGGVDTSTLFLHTKTTWDRRMDQNFELEIDGEHGKLIYRLEIQHPRSYPGKPYIGRESLDLDGKPLFRFADSQVQLFEDDHSPGVSFPFRSDQSFLPNLETQNSKLQWFKNFISRISVFQLNPFSLDSFSVQDERFLKTNGSNFASWLRHLSDESPEAKLACEKRLSETISNFQSFRFVLMGDRKALLASFTNRDGSRYDLPILQLSEGHRILAILYSILYGSARSSSVLCFDEPENFVSIMEIQPWLQELRDLTEETSGQTLVVSHHPEVIDYLTSDSAFLFERTGGNLTRASAWEPNQELTKLMKPSEILAREG